MKRVSIAIVSLLLCCGVLAQGLIVNPYRFVSVGGSTLNTSLIAYWDMDEASGNALDSETTGTAQDLTDNATVTTAAGKVGTSRQFVNANSEYLSRADSADTSTGDINFSIAAWVYLDSNPVASRFIASKWGAVGQREWRLDWNGGTGFFQFVVSNDGTATAVAAASTFGIAGTGTWYFVAAWHDASANTINISVNDGAANSTAHSTGVFDSTGPIQVGAASSVGSGYWDGRIDEVGFWKKVLSGAEITELYNGGSGLTYPF